MLIKCFLFFPMITSAADLTLLNKGVYDGDTIKSELPSLPYPLSKVSIRIKGLDTPELRTYKCQKEKDLAQLARQRLIDLTKNTQYIILIFF